MKIKCEPCEGRGNFPNVVVLDKGEATTFYDTCIECEGTGEMIEPEARLNISSPQFLRLT